MPKQTSACGADINSVFLSSTKMIDATTDAFVQLFVKVDEEISKEKEREIRSNFECGIQSFNSSDAQSLMQSFNSSDAEFPRPGEMEDGGVKYNGLTMTVA